MVKFIDYLNKCLQNNEFRKYWGAENLIIEEDNVVDTFSVWETLHSLTENNLDEIIKNKGIKATIQVKTIIEFYSNSKGCPVETFLNTIRDEKQKVKVLENIYKLSTEGPEVKYSLSEYVADGIYELRTKQQSNIDRIFYFFVFGNKIILTNGYVKKSQKMEQNEFEKAKKYRDEYLRR